LIQLLRLEAEVVEVNIQVTEQLRAMELAEALEVAVDFQRHITLVVRLLQQVKEMLVVTVNMLVFCMALAAAAVALVRQAEPMYLAIPHRMAVLDLLHQLQEHLLIMLAGAGQAMVLALLVQAVLVVGEMEIHIVLVITLLA
jgi:hypothetical protein